VVELWINDLLPQDMKDTIKYTSRNRIHREELSKFAEKLGVLMTSIGIAKHENNQK
jgi:hypothetical protein